MNGFVLVIMHLLSVGVTLQRLELPLFGELERDRVPPSIQCKLVIPKETFFAVVSYVKDKPKTKFTLKVYLLLHSRLRIHKIS